MVLHKQMIDTTTELSVLPFDFAVFQKDIVFIDKLNAILSEGYQRRLFNRNIGNSHEYESF